MAIYTPSLGNTPGTSPRNNSCAVQINCSLMAVIILASYDCEPNSVANLTSTWCTKEVKHFAIAEKIHTWLVVSTRLKNILVSCFTPCRGADDYCSCARDAPGAQKVRPCWFFQNEHANSTLTPKRLKGEIPPSQMLIATLLESKCKGLSCSNGHIRFGTSNVPAWMRFTVT